MTVHRKLDGLGQPIPTYDQAIIEGFAHMFTRAGPTRGFADLRQAFRDVSSTRSSRWRCIRTYHDTG